MRSTIVQNNWSVAQAATETRKGSLEVKRQTLEGRTHDGDTSDGDADTSIEEKTTRWALAAVCYAEY
jgi:hypothetical protein